MLRRRRPYGVSSGYPTLGGVASKECLAVLRLRVRFFVCLSPGPAGITGEKPLTSPGPLARPGRPRRVSRLPAGPDGEEAFQDRRPAFMPDGAVRHERRDRK